MDAVTSGLSSVGKAKSFFNLVVAHVVAIPVALLGLTLIFKRRILTGHVTGRVSEAPTCGTPLIDELKCKIRVTYRFANEENDRTTEQLVPRRTEFITQPNGSQTTKIHPLHYMNGQEVSLYYDPNNPTSTIQLESDDWRVLGWILLVISCTY